MKLPTERALVELARRLADHAGLVLPRWVVAARMRERMQDLGLTSEDAYLALCGSPRGAAEIGRLVEAVRVGETRFFRHEAHVSALVDTVVPALRERRERGPVRVWSAGCASGEEAYTLAMILGELLPRPRYQVQILGTDVSAQAIELAEHGEYPADAVARVPERWRARAFDRVVTGRVVTGRVATGRVATGERGASECYRVAPGVARCVRFERRNLASDPYPMEMDIIWCRNVFIYFTPEVRNRVARGLAQSLAPDGVLFIGYSENLRDIDQLEPVHTPHAVLYRKRRPADERAQPRVGQVADPGSGPVPMRRDMKSAPVPVLGRTEPPGASGPGQTTGQTTGQITGQRALIGHKTLRLSGRYHGDGRLSAELSTLMSGRAARVVVDLDGAEWLADEVAPLLRRARSAAQATGVSFALETSRPGIERWLRRHGLAADEPERGDNRDAGAGE